MACLCLDQRAIVQYRRDAALAHGRDMAAVDLLNKRRLFQMKWNDYLVFHHRGNKPSKILDHDELLRVSILICTPEVLPPLYKNIIDFFFSGTFFFFFLLLVGRACMTAYIPFLSVKLYRKICFHFASRVDGAIHLLLPLSQGLRQRWVDCPG